MSENSQEKNVEPFAFAVGTVTMNKSGRSFKIRFGGNYRCGVVSKKDLLLLIDGKISCAEIVVFKSFILQQHTRKHEPRPASRGDHIE